MDEASLSMRHTTIRAILTDFDGVLRHFPKERDAAIEYEFHLPPGILSKTAFQTGLLYSAVTGQITDEQWRSSIVDSLSKKINQIPIVGPVTRHK